MIYPAISIQQPWAHAIVYRGKNIENRTWKCPKKYMRRTILIHAGAQRARNVNYSFYPALQGLESASLKMGGIIGCMEIVGDTFNHESQWGETLCQNWVIKNVKELPFFLCKGKLRFFDVSYPYEVPCGL